MIVLCPPPPMIIGILLPVIFSLLKPNDVEAASVAPLSGEGEPGPNNGRCCANRSHNLYPTSYPIRSIRAALRSAAMTAAAAAAASDDAASLSASPPSPISFEALEVSNNCCLVSPMFIFCMVARTRFASSAMRFSSCSTHWRIAASKNS